MDNEFSYEMLSNVARQFYLEDISKVEIAELNGISRFKVARMLQIAREQGVVSIEVHDRGDQLQGLGGRLAEHLGLESALVVQDGGSEDATRRRIAREAARLLTKTTVYGDTIGVSWGRTISLVSEYVQELPTCRIVQLTGTVGNDIGQSPLEVLRRIAARQKHATVGILAPLFATNAGVAAILRSEATIAAALAVHDQLSTALIAIGSWRPRITQIDSFLSQEEWGALDEAGAVAEIVGIFLDESGRVVDASLNDRRIAIDLEQLRATPVVIAAAGTVPKVPAIRAVVASGVVSTLITDEAAAYALLQLPHVGKGNPEHD